MEEGDPSLALGMTVYQGFVKGGEEVAIRK
jgi:hypothetical protein